MVPGDTRAQYTEGSQARQILNDCEDDLRDWRPESEEYVEAVEQQDAPVEQKQPVSDIEPESKHAEREATADA